MKKRKQRHLSFKLLVAVLFFTGCSVEEETPLPYYVDADFTPYWFEEGTLELQQIHKIRDFEFTNQNGESVTEQTFENKIYIADFFFTGCGGICPKMTSNMKTIQQQLKNDAEVLLLSHSVTPERDSVSVLNEYANNVGAISGKWHLVTGERKNIYSLARKFYFADEKRGKTLTENDFLHTENFILIDKKKRIRGVYKGTFPTEIERLLEDIELLKKEI